MTQEWKNFVYLSYYFLIKTQLFVPIKVVLCESKVNFEPFLPCLEIMFHFITCWCFSRPISCLVHVFDICILSGAGMKTVHLDTSLSNTNIPKTKNPVFLYTFYYMFFVRCNYSSWYSKWDLKVFQMLFFQKTDNVHMQIYYVKHFHFKQLGLIACYGL